MVRLKPISHVSEEIHDQPIAIRQKKKTLHVVGTTCAEIECWIWWAAETDKYWERILKGFSRWVKHQLETEKTTTFPVFFGKGSRQWWEAKHSRFILYNRFIDLLEPTHNHTSEDYRYCEVITATSWWAHFWQDIREQSRLTQAKVIAPIFRCSNWRNAETDNYCKEDKKSLWFGEPRRHRSANDEGDEAREAGPARGPAIVRTYPLNVVVFS